MLKSITTNEYTTKDFFSFAKKIEEFYPDIVMVSFEVKSLFTNIPRTETIGLCFKNLYRNHTHVDSISKSYFCRLLESFCLNDLNHFVGMFESFFIFDQKYYKQRNDVAMDSPLRPTLINVFK